MENRDFKGVWIPREIWFRDDIKISTVEKCYLGMIDSGFSEKETDYWMKQAGIKSLTRIKTELYLKKLYIPEKFKDRTPEEAKNFTIENSHKGQRCEWCGKECYILHEHHYPIPAKNGGTEIVRICPNCHMTYHSIKGDIK